MPNLGNRRSVQKSAQKAGSYVLKEDKVKMNYISQNVSKQVINYKTFKINLELKPY